MPTYINRTGNSNKMWKYTFLPNSAARIEWGRIGLEGQEQIKEFGSDWERDRAIQKLVGEKLRKGYEESSDQDLQAEVKTAQTIGHKNKIARLEWVSLKGRVMSILGDYDPSKYVYVEVMDSWSREITRLLISKKENWEITGGVTESDRRITFGERGSVFGDKIRFVEAVREKLKAMAVQVSAAISTITFAAVGKRNLFDDEGGETAEVAPVLDNLVANSGMSRGVVSKFAALGQRTLDL
jgi:predicted DNA-binding WGR domain protein